MSFLKSLFGSKDNSPEEKKKDDDNKKFETLKYDGVRALKQGQTDLAIKFLARAIELSDDLECRDYLSRAYIRADQLPLAAEQIKVMSEAQPDNVAITVQLAEVAYMMEDYNMMADACEKAIAREACDARIFFAYARAHKGLGHEAEAIDMLDKAIEQRPDMADARLLRGEMLLAKGDTEGAGADAEALMEQAPDSEEVLLLAARIAHATHDDDKAIKTYGKVIDVNPFCVAAFRERGALLLAQGDENGAKADLQMVMELDPEAAGKVADGGEPESIEDSVKKAYNAINPFGLFNN